MFLCSHHPPPLQRLPDGNRGRSHAFLGTDPAIPADAIGGRHHIFHHLASTHAPEQLTVSTDEDAITVVACS